MKKSIALGLALAATMVGALATSGSAMAVVPVVPPVIHNGNVCEAYSGPSAANFYHQEDGFYNYGAFADTATCPLIITHTPGKLTGSVSLTYNTSSFFDCYLNTRRGNGNFWASVQKFTPILGAGTITWNNVPVAATSNYNVTCNLPAFGNGHIVSVISSF
ncbi:MAG: hypothetical protein ABL933_00585 [Methyloglobulus sp.]|nr:hypothetical protein [Methyloglobulus sp.]